MSGFARRAAQAPSQDFGPMDLGGVGPMAGGNPLAAMGMHSLYGNAAMKGGGFPFQAQLEGVFGQDLSGLDVMVGGAANGALEGLNAAGASMGGKIMLPSNPSFEQVTHEVAHGLQAEQFGTPTTGVSQGGERAELEADRAVDLASQGKPVELNAAPTAAVHRWGLGDLWEDTKGAVGGAIDTVADVGGAAWEGATEIGGDVLDLAVDTATLPTEMIVDGVSNGWNTLGNVAEVAMDPNRSLGEKFADGGMALVSGAWDNLGDQLSNVATIPGDAFSLVQDVVHTGADIGTSLVGGVADNVLPYVADAISGGGGVIGDVVQTGGNFLGDVVSGGSGLVGDLVSGGGGLLGDLVSGGSDLVGDLVSGGGGLLGDLVSGGGGLLGDLVAGGGDLLSGGVDALSGLVSDGIGAGVGLGQDLLSGIGGLDTGISFIDDLVDAGTGGLSDLLGAGGGLAQDLVEGGGDLLSWGIDTFSGWGSDALTGLGDLLSGGISGLSDLVGDGISGLGGLVGDGIGGLSDLVGDGISGLGGLIGDGIGGLSDLVGGGIRDGSAWLGDGLGTLASTLSGASQSVRDFFGLDEKPNDFTGYIEMRPSSEGFEAQYSELGIPLTDKAWGFQDEVDGGKLHDLYDRSLLGSLSESGVIDDLVSRGVLQPGQVPDDFSQMSSADLRALTDIVEANTGNAEQFLNTLERDDRTEFQQSILHNYMEMARNDTNAAFIFELLPTETGGDVMGDMGEELGDAVIRGQGPNNFAVGEAVGNARVSDVRMAETYRQQGKNTYGLVVPYANTPGNVVGRTGTPTDGSDHLQNYLNMLVDPETGERNITTAATGYSQGGAAVLDYVDRYGDTGLLDNAVAIAPMGGTDRHGGTGVHSGEWNGVNTLAIMNEQDPAQHIHGDNLLSLAPGMINFMFADVPGMQHAGERHGTYWGQAGSGYDLPPGMDPTEAFSAGTFGYPTEYAAPMIQAMLNGEYDGYEYAHRGAWDYDLNEELVNKDANGVPTDWQLRGNPQEIADRYHPGR